MYDIVIVSLKGSFCWNKSVASCKEMNSQYLQSYEYAMYYVMLLELHYFFFLSSVMLGKDYTIDYRRPKIYDYAIYGCVCGQLVVRNIASKLCRSDIVLENSC